MDNNNKIYFLSIDQNQKMEILITTQCLSTQCGRLEDLMLMIRDSLASEKPNYEMISNVYEIFTEAFLEFSYSNDKFYKMIVSLINKHTDIT